MNGFGKPRRREVPGAEAAESTLPPGAAPGGGVSLTGTPDGDENLSKSALKNKKKREAKKAKDAEAKVTTLAAPAADRVNGSSGHNSERWDRPRSRSKSGHESPRPQSRRREGSRTRGPPLKTSSPVPASKVNLRAPDAPAPAEPPGLTITSPGGDGSPSDKKIRSLLKKLRAIDDLKMRQAGGEKLEGTQIMKIGTEEGVRKDLGALGWKGEE
ncbi:hypothetical protein LTR28_008961 [Elasticomyces elasticus]|nr:hypothetical protein LTR28_008961 [Elasticomyces elasticus]